MPPTLRLECLYTRHKTQKRKTWKDGRLDFSGSRLRLFDANPLPGSENPALDDIELTPDRARNVSDMVETELETDKYLITVEGPWKGRETVERVVPVAVVPRDGTGMRKLLSRKFRKPGRFAPPRPEEKRRKLEERRALFARRAPLQPGELERQLYGDGREGAAERPVGVIRGDSSSRQSGHVTIPPPKRMAQRFENSPCVDPIDIYGGEEGDDQEDQEENEEEEEEDDHPVNFGSYTRPHNQNQPSIENQNPYSIHHDMPYKDLPPEYDSGSGRAEVDNELFQFKPPPYQEQQTETPSSPTQDNSSLSRGDLLKLFTNDDTDQNTNQNHPHCGQSHPNTNDIHKHYLPGKEEEQKVEQNAHDPLFTRLCHAEERVEHHGTEKHHHTVATDKTAATNSIHNCNAGFQFMLPSASESDSDEDQD